MKKIVYAVYHDTNKEERSKELLNCCRKMGQVDFISYAIPREITDIRMHLINKRSIFALITFIKTTKKVIKEVQPDYVVLHDNDCSAIIPFVKKQHKDMKIIYDSSELYIKRKTKLYTESKKKKFWGTDGILIWLKQKCTSFRAYYEKKYLKDADVVLAANYERAKIMQEYFSLNTLPIIFDNIHRIDDDFDEVICRNKFDNIVDKNRFNILFGGGLSEERKTFDYIKAVNKLDDRINLIIAGSASNVAKKRYDEIIKKNGSHKLHYVGFVSRAELKYLMRVSQASVVVFDKNSFNTLYCASGKCYESLFEGTPILASENPPLKRLCSEEHIGVSNDDYTQGIIQLIDNYAYYEEAVKKYIHRLDYEGRKERLVNQILVRLGCTK